MAISEGSQKQTRIKRQSAKGTISGATLGQIVRRTSSTFELTKETYTTENEINSTLQVKSSRHGAKTVNGSIDGNLSPGTYSDPISVVLRKDFAAVANLTGLAIAVAGSPGAYTLTTTGLLAGGLKVGMVIRITAGTGLNVDVLNKNLFITAVTATVATVSVLNGSTMTTGSGTTCTIAIPGKVSYIPDTGHTDLYHTIEEWYPDVPSSEVNTDVKFTKADFTLPGNGNATVKLSAIGLDQTGATTVYFTAPTAETTTETVVAASGVLLVGGVAVATVTSLNISVDGKGAAADPVVGSVVRPDVFTGVISVSGSFTAYFDGVTIPDMFRNETPTTIIAGLAAGSLAASDFMTFTMTNVRINSNTPSDSQTGTTRSYNFVALFNSTGGAALANHATSLMLQDSAAA